MTDDDLLDLVASLDHSVTELHAARERVESYIETLDSESPVQTVTTLPDDTRVHLFQLVAESPETDLFDEEPIHWVVTDVSELGVTLKTPTFSDAKTVSDSEFVDGPYNPVTTIDGHPVWSY